MSPVCLVVEHMALSPLSGQHVRGCVSDNDIHHVCHWTQALNYNAWILFLRTPGTEEQQRDLLAEMSASAWSPRHAAAFVATASGEHQPPGLA